MSMREFTLVLFKGVIRNDALALTSMKMIKRVRLEVEKYSFSCRVVNEWNAQRENISMIHWQVLRKMLIIMT